MSKRYPILVTFVNQINPRSYEAHHRKLGLDIIQEFEFNDNRYWEMGCLTSKVINNDNINIREANKEDIDSILLLVNRAYRSNHGWTNESNLVSGDRVEPSEIINYLENPKTHLFVLTLKERVEACICIEELNFQAYIGFFAVNPNLQGQGIGKKLLTFAEDFSYKSLKLTHFKMAVLADRYELIDFYLRRSYQKTEQITKYPKDSHVGTPKREDLMVIYLEKELCLLS